MCDHAHAVAAAMRCHSIDAEVLPPPDEESLAIGRELCLGRECLPCFTCIGDMVRQARQAGFEPTASAYFMPSAGGPCRFGQSRYLQRQILDRLGLCDLEMLSPSSENGYAGLGAHPLRFRRLAWQAIVAVDLLRKFLHESRPYEAAPGTADRLYGDLLHTLVAAVEAGGGQHTAAVMRKAAQRFARLPIHQPAGRPLIGVVGELYVRDNPFTNQDLPRQVEALGGEVWVEPIMEYFYYVNHIYQLRVAGRGRYGELLSAALTGWIQRWDEWRVLRLVAARLRNRHEPAVPLLARFARPYYEPFLQTEAVLTLGRGVGFFRQGLDGILNLMPFTCMPGTIVAGLSEKVRADCGQIPWLNVVYDSQGETNLNTRLEAFMYQAGQYRQERLRRGGG
jgi:predicted nucleotide-binding protein (sugar kinase/HSP70/actin superfamily)